MIISIHLNRYLYDGDARYYGPIMNADDANVAFSTLLKEIHWEPDTVVMFGKSITTKRKVAWYADAPFPYTYSKSTKVATYWTPQLLHLKSQVE